MPQPLLDRMEIIRIPGYTEDEKVEIAKRHLLPKQAEAHGLKKDEWSVTDDALLELVRTYTREAGVRNLEREIATLARKAVKEIVTAKTKKVAITKKNLEKFSGVPKFRYGETEAEDMVGVVTGLAWTEVGGEILTIESVLLPGKGGIKQTGKLGDVMQESVQAAYSYIRSRATQFGIKPPFFDKRDIHVHVPEGATPKDGPSAGIAMATSIVCAITGIPIRSDIAMTGEITLRGRVLPIGGLKEKLLAALRAGITTVFIPKDNEKDLIEIPENVKKGLTIIPVSHVDEVIGKALVRAPEPIEWDDTPEELAKASDGESLPRCRIRRGRRLTGGAQVRYDRAPPRFLWSARLGLRTSLSHSTRLQGVLPVNKNDLIAAVAEDAELSKAKAAEVVDAVFGAIEKTLKKKEEVRLVGFGTFATAEREASKGRNPRTGEEIDIPASTSIRFKPGKTLKDAVN